MRCIVKHDVPEHGLQAGQVVVVKALAADDMHAAATAIVEGRDAELELHPSLGVGPDVLLRRPGRPPQIAAVVQLPRVIGSDDRQKLAADLVTGRLRPALLLPQDPPDTPKAAAPKRRRAEG